MNSNSNSYTSYTETIISTTNKFAQELNRFYEKNKDVILANHYVPSHLLDDDLKRKDITHSDNIITFRFEDVEEDWSEKDEKNQPKVKGLLFSVDAEIEKGMGITMVFSSNDTLEKIKEKMNKFISLKIVNYTQTLSNLKTMLNEIYFNE